jgi:hypothetical protein
VWAEESARRDPGDSKRSVLTDPVDISLEEVVNRWRGQQATLDIDLVVSEMSDVKQSLRYEGILDGPYLGDGLGIGLMLGSRVMSGDIAIEGPYIDFAPARRVGRSDDRVVTDGYLELHVTDLPLRAYMGGTIAVWGATLADGGIARCWLMTAQTRTDAVGKREDLTWGVDARIVATAPPVYRPGAVASVYGFRSDPPVSDDDLVGVEFVDGSSVEIPAGMLERLG